MPTDQTLGTPKVEMSPQLCEEEDAVLKVTFKTIISFNINISVYVCWIRRNAMLVGQTQYAAG